MGDAAGETRPDLREFWAGGEPEPVELDGLRDQPRVDAIQQAVRAGLPTSAYEDCASGSTQRAGQLHERVAEEINYVARLMESFGDQLASDPAILLEHTKALQSIDLANQILTQLASVIAADDPDGSVAQIGMSDLRARLTRTQLPIT